MRREARGERRCAKVAQGLRNEGRVKGERTGVPGNPGGPGGPGSGADGTEGLSPLANSQ